MEEEEWEDWPDHLDHLLCPITQAPFVDPVNTDDQYMYEREAIMSWLRTHNWLSPMTRQPILPDSITPNLTIRNQVREQKEMLLRKRKEGASILAGRPVQNQGSGDDGDTSWSSNSSQERWDVYEVVMLSHHKGLHGRLREGDSGLLSTDVDAEINIIHDEVVIQFRCNVDTSRVIELLRDAVPRSHQRLKMNVWHGDTLMTELVCRKSDIRAMVDAFRALGGVESAVSEEAWALYLNALPSDPTITVRYSKTQDTAKVNFNVRVYERRTEEELLKSVVPEQHRQFLGTTLGWRVASDHLVSFLKALLPTHDVPSALMTECGGDELVQAVDVDVDKRRHGAIKEVVLDDDDDDDDAVLTPCRYRVVPVGGGRSSKRDALPSPAPVSPVPFVLSGPPGGPEVMSGTEASPPSKTVSKGPRPVAVRSDLTEDPVIESPKPSTPRMVSGPRPVAVRSEVDHEPAVIAEARPARTTSRPRPVAVRSEVVDAQPTLVTRHARTVTTPRPVAVRSEVIPPPLQAVPQRKSAAAVCKPRPVAQRSSPVGPMVSPIVPTPPVSGVGSPAMPGCSSADARKGVHNDVGDDSSDDGDGLRAPHRGPRARRIMDDSEPEDGVPATVPVSSRPRTRASMKAQGGGSNSDQAPEGPVAMVISSSESEGDMSPEQKRRKGSKDDKTATRKSRRRKRAEPSDDDYSFEDEDFGHDSSNSESEYDRKKRCKGSKAKKTTRKSRGRKRAEPSDDDYSFEDEVGSSSSSSSESEYDRRRSEKKRRKGSKDDKRATRKSRGRKRAEPSDDDYSYEDEDEDGSSSSSSSSESEYDRRRSGKKRRKGSKANKRATRKSRGRKRAEPSDDDYSCEDEDFGHDSSSSESEYDRKKRCKGSKAKKTTRKSRGRKRAEPSDDDYSFEDEDEVGRRSSSSSSSESEYDRKKRRKGSKADKRATRKSRGRKRAEPSDDDYSYEDEDEVGSSSSSSSESEYDRRRSGKKRRKGSKADKRATRKSRGRKRAEPSDDDYSYESTGGQSTEECLLCGEGGLLIECSVCKEWICHRCGHVRNKGAVPEFFVCPPCQPKILSKSPLKAAPSKSRGNSRAGDRVRTPRGDERRGRRHKDTSKTKTRRHRRG